MELDRHSGESIMGRHPSETFVLRSAQIDILAKDYERRMQLRLAETLREELDPEALAGIKDLVAFVERLVKVAYSYAIDEEDALLKFLRLAAQFGEFFHADSRAQRYLGDDNLSGEVKVLSLACCIGPEDWDDIARSQRPISEP